MKTYKRKFKPYGKIKDRKRKQLNQKIVLIFILTFFVISGGTLITTFKGLINDITGSGAVDTIVLVAHAQTNVATVLEPRMTVEQQIRQIAQEGNFQWPDYLVRLAYCESRFNQYAVGDNGNSRGIFQIHKGYWPGITDEQAFNVEFSTRWTMQKINDGKQGLWTCDRIIRNK